MPVSRNISPFAVILLAGLAPGFINSAQAEILTNAKEAILYDYDTNEILFCKDCDQPMPPSSMSKLMTVELVFQRLKDGRLKPTDTFHASETAWRQGQKDNESKMWVALNSDVPVDDLLKGIIVQSGGDACVVVAEALGGSELGFADQMNARAKDLGRVGKLAGVDVSSESITVARQNNPAIRYDVFDGTHLPFNYIVFGVTRYVGG